MNLDKDSNKEDVGYAHTHKTDGRGTRRSCETTGGAFVTANCLMCSTFKEAGKILMRIQTES